MRILFIAVLICLSSSLTLSAQGNLSGIWNTGNQNTLVKVEKQDNAFLGKIISTDSKNAKPGTLIMKNVKMKNENGVGKLYAPKRKEWYDAKFCLTENKLTITITVGFFSKTVEWTKIEG